MEVHNPHISGKVQILTHLTPLQFDGTKSVVDPLFRFQTIIESAFNSPHLGKLLSFTNLNLAAIKGDDFPEIHQGLPGFGRRS